MRTYAPIVTALLLISLAGNWYFWQSALEQERNRLSDFSNLNQVIESRTAEIQSRDTLIRDIRAKVGKDSVKHFSEASALKTANSSLARKIAQLRPLIAPDLAENDTLNAFVVLQDSLLQGKDSLLYRQEIFCTARVRDLRDIILLTEQQLAAQREITGAVTEQLADSDHERRKERRGKRFWTTVSAVLSGGILYMAIRE